MDRKSYGDAEPYHAVDRIEGTVRLDYDGNMTARNKGLAGQQTLVWDGQNRLSQVQDSQGNLLERYWYDLDGARVKKVSGTTTTNTFFGHYEKEVSGDTITIVRYYSFAGQRVAVSRGVTLSYLHGDQLSSNSLATDGSGAVIGGGEVSLAPKTGPQAKVYNGAIHRACGGEERWSRNGGDSQRPTSFGLRWKRLKAARRLASYRVSTRFIPT